MSLPVVPLLAPLGALAAPPTPAVHIDRAARRIHVLDEAGTVVHSEPVGVGRGGSGTKTTMRDRKTPTGRFVVDLILDDAGQHLAVAPGPAADPGTEPALRRYLSDTAGLRRLWSNMSGLDFNGDGRPDKAYGRAYIGLDSPTGGAVTGPKMRRHGSIPYWYSIALHGTPDPTSLGAARSGGCVHLSEALISRLLASGHLQIGAEVVIADGPPR